jgi:hypothetical protein
VYSARDDVLWPRHIIGQVVQITARQAASPLFFWSGTPFPLAAQASSNRQPILSRQLSYLPSHLCGCAALRTHLPLSAIHHTPHLIRDPNSAAVLNTGLLAPQHALPEQLLSFAFLARARVQPAKVGGVLERTTLNELLGWDLLVRADYAVGEAQTDDRVVRIERLRTEGEDVSQALGFAVLAVHPIVIVHPGNNGK